MIKSCLIELVFPVLFIRNSLEGFMKTKLFLLFSPFFFVLVSCVSTIPDILPTYTSAEFQQYYIRQEIVKKNPINSMFDFTILIENGKLIKDITVNYNIGVKDFLFSEIKNVEVAFLNNDEEFPLTFSNIIFINTQKRLVRISATLTPNQFLRLTQSDQKILVRFTHPQLETVTILSKGLNKKLSEARFLLL